MNSRVLEDSKIQAGNEPGYQVVSDKSVKQSANRDNESVFVSLNRRTVDPRENGLVDTRLNDDKGRRKGPYGEEYGSTVKKSRHEEPYSSRYVPQES